MRMLIAFGLFWMATGALAVDAPVVIYDRNPEHLWNRVHRALFVRQADGVEYGADQSVPFLDDGDDLLTGETHAKAIAVLDEFVQKAGEKMAPGETNRALFLHDLWGAFDVAAMGDGQDLLEPRRALRERLAIVIRRLVMSDESIGRLPDNYQQATEWGAFLKEFDPARPSKAFLPVNLFDPKGPWVEIGEQAEPVAPAHVRALSGRSVFRVFIHCPGGRDTTLGYLEKLNLHRTPWELKPAEIATRSPDSHKVRWDPLRLDPKTPQLPEGTMVALVRQMVLINDKLEPVATRLTQSAQFRVYKRIAEGQRFSVEGEQKDQAFFEIAMRRKELLARRAGGLHQIAPDESEFQMMQFGRPIDETRQMRLRGLVVMDTCAKCHHQNGIFSVHTYTDFFGPRQTNPQLLPVPDNDPDNQARAVVAWKKRQFDWGLLRGLLERG